jgi:peptidoglycan hydrolase-like protein with peptidoglycan-binding domain
MKGRIKSSIINHLVSLLSFKLFSRKNLLRLLLCSSVPLLFGSPSVASVTVEQQIAQVINAGTVNRPTLKVGSQGEAVSELQAALKIMGFYNGAVDGTYSQTTAEAVSQFKQSTGLQPDGVVDAATWQQLFPGSQTTVANTDETPTTTTATTTRNNFPTPNQNAANLPRPVVISNQESTTTTSTRRNTGNGQQETVRTSSTVRTTNNSRSGTSRQTTRTTNATNTSNRGRSSTTSSSNRTNTTSANTSNRGRSTTTTTSTRNNTSNTARSTYRTRQPDPNLQKPDIQYTAAGFPILRLGMRGEEVYDLQTRLQRLGYLKKDPDGDFGAETQTAVKALQRRFGMEEDGVAGGETWEILTRRRTNRSQS